MTIDYGTDIWCDASLRTGRYADELRLVAQNAVHRLTTPRGMLRGGEEEQNYGLDLPGEVGKVASDSEANALPGKIRAELTKDPRILLVNATVTKSTDGPATSYTIAIECGTEAGVFSLAASEVTVELVGLGGGA